MVELFVSIHYTDYIFFDCNTIMQEQDTKDSIVGAAMDEIGGEGSEYHPIDNFVPLALSEATDVVTKRLVLLLIATRCNQEINDVVTLESIICAIARQDPAAAFTALFHARDASLRMDLLDIIPSEHRRGLPREDFVFKNAIPLVDRLPEKDLPLCTAFVFDAVMCTRRGERVENLLIVAQAVLDRLDKSFPGETERLCQHLSSLQHPPGRWLLERIFSRHNGPTRAGGSLFVKRQGDYGGPDV